MSGLARLGWPERTVVAGLFVALAAFFPWFEEIHSANELSRLYLANAMVQDGTVAIDRQLQQLGPTHDKAVKDGHFYSDKAPGVALWAAPVVWSYLRFADAPSLAGEMRLARLWVSTIPTALLLLFLLVFLAEHIADRGLRLVLVTAYALGSLATTYGLLLFGHQLSAVVLFAAFLCARRAGPDVSAGRALAVGALCAAALLVEYQNVVFVLPLAVFFLVRTRANLRALALAVAGAAPLLVVLGAYHHAAFGSAFKTGYSFLDSSFKDVHAQGLLGIKTPRLDHLWLSLLSPAKGLFAFAPWLVLAVPGLALAWRAGGDGRMALVMALLMTLFVASMVYPDGGWTVSQRHLTPMVPWLLLPVGLFVQRVPWTRPVLTGLVVVSVVVTGVSTIVWPHYQEQLRNPFFQVGWPLFEDGWLPPSLFGAVGLSSKTVALAIGVLVAAGLAYDLVRSGGRPWRVAAWLAIAVALPILWRAGMRGVAADQDVRRDVTWIQSVYQPDPVKPPR